MLSGDTELTQDVLFDVLSSSRRRYVLHVLKTEGEMELATLVEHVAAREADSDIEDLTKQQRKRVYVSLYQTHVPKLKEAGLVRYDEDEQVVELRSGADEIAGYLGNDTESFPWQYVYIAIALGGLTLIALAATDVIIFGALPATGVALAFVGLLLMTAVTHTIVWNADAKTDFPEFLQEE